MTSHPALHRSLTVAALGLAAVLLVLGTPPSVAAANVWRAPDARAAADTTAAALRFSGRTSQNGPVSMTVSNGLTTVNRFTIQVEAKCRVGRGLTTTVSTDGIPVKRTRRGRSFTRTGGSSLPLQNGLSASTRATTTGRLTPQGSTGTFSLTATIVSVTGQLVDTCRAENIRFRTSRR